MAVNPNHYDVEVLMLNVVQPDMRTASTTLMSNPTAASWSALMLIDGGLTVPIPLEIAIGMSSIDTGCVPTNVVPSRVRVITRGSSRCDSAVVDSGNLT